MRNGFEELRLDNVEITGLDLLKLAKEEQRRVVEKANKKVKRYDGEDFETYKKEARKLDYIEWKIKDLEREGK